MHVTLPRVQEVSGPFAQARDDVGSNGVRKELLRTTNLPVSEVAGRVGYAEAKYFVEVFHRSEGVTPLSYRRKMKADDRS